MNNYGDLEDKIAALRAWKAVTYCVVGEEVGESGTPHLQGYTEMNASKKFDTVQNKLYGAHIEHRRGTAVQAADYCKKDGKFVEWGEISNQGARNDLSVAVAMIKEGKRMREVAEQESTTFVKFHKGLKALKSELVIPRNEVPVVTVLYGTTGKGKSKKARELMGSEQYYVWHPQCKEWFDGYEGEKYVIFEEFRGQLPLGMLLSLLDRYDCKVQQKGGMIEFAATNIVITSPLHPNHWYKESELNKYDKIEQLLRRVTCLRDLDQEPMLSPTVPC